MATAVRRFIKRHASLERGPNAIFFPQWEQDWKGGAFPIGDAPFRGTHIWFAELRDDREKNALADVCVWMLRLLLDGDTPDDKAEHATGLMKALRKYLYLRGYDVPTPDTFRRYLTTARQALGESKYTRRGRRTHGRSIARGGEIEYQRGDAE